MNQCSGESVQDSKEPQATQVCRVSADRSAYPRVQAGSSVMHRHDAPCMCMGGWRLLAVGCRVEVEVDVGEWVEIGDGALDTGLGLSRSLPSMMDMLCLKKCMYPVIVKGKRRTKRHVLCPSHCCSVPVRGLSPTSHQQLSRDHLRRTPRCHTVVTRRRLNALGCGILVDLVGLKRHNLPARVRHGRRLHLNVVCCVLALGGS